MSGTFGQPEPRGDAATPADLFIVITGPGPDDLRALRAWLMDEDKLRGRVQLVAGDPVPGTMGAALEALSVSVGSGGAVSVMVTGVMSWFRQRYDQRRAANLAVIKLRCANGASVEIPAATLGTRSAAEINAQIRELAEILTAGSASSGTGSASSGAGSASSGAGSASSGTDNRSRDLT